MSRITVELLEAPQHHIRLYANQAGRVYFDTGSEFGLRLTKGLEELTEANEIQQEAALSTTIPQTAKNRGLLEQFEANVVERETKYLRVEIRKDGDPLPIDRMKVVKFQDRNQNIEVEFIGTGWILDLESTPLNKIEGLGTFENTIAGREAAWDDPTSIAVPMVADYGGWLTPGDVTRKDTRLVFNLTKLMRAALCQHGWTFKSPYWDGEAGSQVYGYLSPPDWYTYEGKTDQFAVELEVATPQTIPGEGTFFIFDEVSDPFDLYDNLFRPGEYLYPPAGQDPIELQFKIRNLRVTIPPYGQGNPPNAFVIACYRNTWGSFGPTIFFETVNGALDQPITVDLSFDFSDEEARPGYSYGFIFGGISLTPDNSPYYDIELESCDVLITPNAPHYGDGDQIPLQDILTSEMNAADLFKDMARLINGKVLTNYITKEVTLYPPFNTSVKGEQLEGFFKRTIGSIDITHLVEPNSREVENKDQGRDRFIELKFKDTNDSYIEETRPGTEPYSRTIDLGTGNAKTTKIELDFFEPTIEREVPPEDIGGTGMILPVLRDNNEGRISTDVGFRIFYNYGKITQLDSDGNERTFSMDGTVRNTIAYLAQASTTAIQGDPTKVTLAFKQFEEDHWRLFYRQWLNEQYSPIDFEYLVRIDLNDYRRFNFRQTVGFFYRDTYLVYQMTAIKDFDLEARTSTPIEMKLLEC